MTSVCLNVGFIWKLMVYCGHVCWSTWLQADIKSQRLICESHCYAIMSSAFMVGSVPILRKYCWLQWNKHDSKWGQGGLPINTRTDGKRLAQFDIYAIWLLAVFGIQQSRHIWISWGILSQSISVSRIQCFDNFYIPRKAFFPCKTARNMYNFTEKSSEVKSYDMTDLLWFGT